MLRKDRRTAPSATADPAEIRRFDALADEWRKPDGRFKVVQTFHRARSSWLLAKLPIWVGRPLAGLPVLDVGCATGLMSEDLAARGCQVTAIDAAGRNIEIARHHARKRGFAIDYQHAVVEDVEGEWPVVITLEVVEHVLDLEAFLEATFLRVRAGGICVIATLNRTGLSWLTAIVGAEYVLGWLPKGTHRWRSFVKPEELIRIAGRYGFEPIERTGFTCMPLLSEWRPTTSLGINYAMVFRRQ